VIAFPIGHARFGEDAAWPDITLDHPLRAFVPLDIEGPELREEAERGIRQVVVNPPGEPLPVAFIAVAVEHPWHDNADRSTHAAVKIPHIPDVMR